MASRHFWLRDLSQDFWLPTLVTADGRYLQFSGSSTAVTQNADTNERVSQVNNAGVIEWHVKREDDSTEINKSCRRPHADTAAKRASHKLYVF
jgi:hypothetical protein